MPRPRKSIEELKASGSYRPCRHAAREQKSNTLPVNPPASAPTAVPASSSGLPAEVAEVRAGIVAVLGARLTPADDVLLDELAERVVEVRKLREASRTAVAGTLAYTRVASALNKATAALDRLAGAFGLTPGSRVGLPATPDKGGVRTW